MADNTSYIGVAMGLDVTDLKAGLSEANKQIQLANSEFKAASSGMEDWTKSTEGLTAKVKQLDTVLTAQKSKLAGLQAEYEKVVAEQGETSEAARKLKVQINNQTAVVNKTQQEFDNYTETLAAAEAGTIDLTEVTLKGGKAVKEMGDGADEAGSKMGGLGGIAKGVVGGIAAVGAAAVAAVGSFLSLAESTRETRENFSRLDVAFEQNGHNAEAAANTYEELYGVLGDTGRATEAAQQLAQMSKTEADLEANTRILTGVMAQYGDSIPTEGLAEGMAATAAMGEVQGVLADALEWQGVNLDEYNAQLSTMSSEEERAAFIQKTLTDLYGESADAFKERNADIIAAREAEAELARVTAELGAIAEPIMTTLKLLAVDLLGAITPFVELIGEGLKGALDGTAGAATTLAEGIGGVINVLVEKVTDMLPTILNVILQLVPAIANTLLSALPQLLTTVTELVVQILNLLSTMLPDIVAKVVEIIPLLINSLVSAIPDLLKAATELLLAIVDAIPTLIASLLSALPEVIDTILSAVLDSIPILLDAAVELFMALVDALPVIIQALIDNLPKVINTIIDGLLTALPMVLEAAVTLLMAIVQALPTIISLLVQEVPKITSTIISTLLSRLPDLIQAAITLFFGILEAIPQIVGELIRQMPQIISAIVTGLDAGLGAIKDIGLNLLKGIWEGIKGGATWLKNKITGFANNVADWFKDTFKIHSPSKLIEDEVGVYVGQAVVPSSPSALAKVKKQLSGFSDYVTDNLGGIKAGLSVNASGAGGVGGVRGGSTIINAGQTIYFNGNLSRKQLKQIENDNYTALKIRLKTEGAI